MLISLIYSNNDKSVKVKDLLIKNANDMKTPRGRARKLRGKGANGEAIEHLPPLEIRFKKLSLFLKVISILSLTGKMMSQDFSVNFVSMISVPRPIGELIGSMLYFIFTKC